MNQRHLIRFLLGLTLLKGGRVSCQSPGDLSTKPAPLSGQFVIPPCEPDPEECKDQIMAHEGLWESQVRSGSVFEEVTIQKLKKDGQNLSVPDADNFYQGETTFGKKAKFRKIFESVKWRPFWWQFDLRGFAEMCFLDPYQFDGTNYELQYRGDEMLLGRRCWVYRVIPRKHAKGWHFEGTIWVLPDNLTIIRFKGAFHPTRKILWFFLVEDNWFFFDSWRKEISPGKWVPDFACTGVDVAGSDFTKPAFKARITFIYEGRDKSGAASENVCEVEGNQFPMRTMQTGPNSGSTRQ